MLEIEVKFFVEKISPYRAAILQLGAKSEGRHFESNLRFDTPDGYLAGKGAMLRLRKTNGKNLVTVKKHVRHNAAKGCKVFEEFETEVANFSASMDIFDVLGFAPYQVYEKYRETLFTPDAKFCLDETPFGYFIEIEADEDIIKKYAEMLDLNWGERIIFSYLEIFDKLREYKQLPFDTLTFANFADHTPAASASDILPMLIARNMATQSV